MPEVKFVLKEPNKDQPTLIYLLFRYNNQKLKYSTGEKINPKLWNPLKQRAKEIRSNKQYLSLNNKLDDLSNKVKTIYRELVGEKKIPTPFKIKDKLNKELFEGVYAQKLSFFKFIDDLIKSSPRKFSTLKQWKQTFRKLIEYKRHTNNDVDFDSINLDFYNDFVNFLNTEGYSKNTIGGFIKNIKIFMNEAIARKLTTNMEYKSKKFRVLEEHVDKIYLSENELLKIYSIDLSKNRRLDKVRDLFIVA